MSNLNRSNCSHCHEILTHTRIEGSDDTLFCCEGCFKVYQLLHGEGMEFYYQLLEMENTSAPQALYKESYQQYLLRLENAEELKEIGSWKNNIHAVDLESSDLHCAACGWLLEKVIPKIKGVKSFEIDFVRGFLHLEYDSSQTQLKLILQHLAQMGYAFMVESREALHAVIPRSLMLKLGVAGGVFANQMLFSIGMYFGSFQGMSQEHLNYFNWASFILSIPVVLWCALPFYQKAISGLKARTAHIDLPISLGIMIAFNVSIWQILEGKHGFFDGVSGLVFFLLIGRLVTQRFEHHLSADPRWFTRILPQKVLKLMGYTEEGKASADLKGEWSELENLQIGDVYSVAPSEYISTESILESHEALLDTQLMTGESQTKKLNRGAVLKAGYRNLKESIRVRVTQKYSDSELYALQQQWNQLSQERKSHSIGEKIVPYFTPTVLLVALITFLSQKYFFGLTNLDALYRACVVLIISCPCALALSRPFSLGMAFKKAKEAGFLLRSERALEKISECDSVFLDKTGTLTFHEQSVESWLWVGDVQKSTQKQKKWRMVIRALCQNSLHPVALTLLDHLEKTELEVEVDQIEESAGVGLRGVLRGEDQGAQIELISVSAYKKRLTQLASSEIPLNTLKNEPKNVLLLNQQVLCWIWLRESIRPEIIDLIQDFKRQKKQVVLVSGDSNIRVKNFAEAVGIDFFYGEQSPDQKLSVLKEWKSKGSKLLAVGDGINDSLMLAESHASVLVIGGAQSMASGVDVLFVGKSLVALSQLFQLAARAEKSISRCYKLSILYNILALGVAFSGVLPPLAAAIAMPLSSLSVGFVSWLTVRSVIKS